MSKQRTRTPNPPRTADSGQGETDYPLEGTEQYSQALYHTHEAERLIDEIAASEKKDAEKAREAGQHLLAAKKAAGHGNWLNWLRDHPKLSERTAERYMRIAEEWDDLREDSGAADPIDPHSSIRAVEDAIVEHKREGESARSELEKSICPYIRELKDSEAIFLCSEEGRPIWNETLAEHMELMREELKQKIQGPSAEWLANRRAHREMEISRANERWTRQQRRRRVVYRHLADQVSHVEEDGAKDTDEVGEAVRTRDVPVDIVCPAALTENHVDAATAPHDETVAAAGQ